VEERRMKRAEQASEVTRAQILWGWEERAEAGKRRECRLWEGLQSCAAESLNRCTSLLRCVLYREDYLAQLVYKR
jgi:hypothetical protein